MFAERMKHLESSGIRRMFELKQKMRDPIDLSLGQPSFDVPDVVKEAAIQAIRDGKNGYTVTAGAPEFRAACLEYLDGEGLHPEAIMGVAGGSGGLLLALLALVDEQCEVLITDPCFATYGHLIRTTGAVPKRIDTYPDLRLTPQRLREAVTPKTRLLLFNSPVNPTGIAYRPEELKALAEEAQRLGLQVISDEVYDLFSYDHPHDSWARYDSDALMIRALSKTWGMPGWRAGFAAGPKDLIDQMNMIQQFTFVCMATPAQWAAIAAFKMDMSAIQESYRRKRDLVYSGLSQEFKLTKPEGAFYAFPEAPHGDCATFLQKCIANEVLIVPGNAFSLRNTNFRISFGQSDEVLKRGIDALCKIARTCRAG